VSQQRELILSRHEESNLNAYNVIMNPLVPKAAGTTAKRQITEAHATVKATMARSALWGELHCGSDGLGSLVVESEMSTSARAFLRLLVALRPSLRTTAQTLPALVLTMSASTCRVDGERRIAVAVTSATNLDKARAVLRTKGASSSDVHLAKAEIAISETVDVMAKASEMAVMSGTAALRTSIMRTKVPFIHVRELRG
jgi:hypothetical protein